MAFSICARFPLAELIRASWVMPPNRGTMTAARMPMMMTTMVSSSRVNARRAREWKRMFMGSFYFSMQAAADLENRQQQSDHNESHHRAHHHDQHRADEGDQRLGMGAHVALLDVRDFEQHAVQGAALLADVDHLDDGAGKNVQLAQGRRQGIAAAGFLGDAGDLPGEDAIANGMFHRLQRGQQRDAAPG